MGSESNFLCALFDEPDCLTLELAREVFPVSHDALSAGIVSPFEVSAKSGQPNLSLVSLCMFTYPLRTGKKWFPDPLVNATTAPEYR